MPAVHVEGTPLAYDETGSGPPLVLVHAAIADRRMWDPVVPLLADAFRVIRYDARGFGASPAADGPFAHWRDLAAVIQGLDAAPARLIGVSMGGGTVLAVAAEQPDLLERMVVIAPGIGFSEPSPAILAFWEAEDAALEGGDLDAAAEVNVRTWLDGPTRASAEVDPAIRSLVFDMQRRAFELANPASVEERPAKPLRSRLPSITTPMLVMVGELDQPDMLEASRAAAEATQARFISMPGVAHLPPLEAPEAFVALVRPFLEG
jgi:pimeloyl-ACP methyl ester carboxylesterase